MKRKTIINTDDLDRFVRVLLKRDPPYIAEWGDEFECMVSTQCYEAPTTKKQALKKAIKDAREALGLSKPSEVRVIFFGPEEN